MFAIIITLLLANLGAIGGTWQQVGTLASQVAVTAKIAVDNEQDTKELRVRVLELERGFRNPTGAGNGP